jgi:hypothetical protein
MAYLDPIGFAPFYGMSGAAGVILGGKLAVEGAVASGASCGGSNCQYATTLHELRAKIFLGNSFFLNLGAASEDAAWDHTVAWGQADEANAAFKARAITRGVTAAIGNLWQVHHFVIGCDWLGYYWPTSMQSFTFTEEPGYDAASATADTDKAKSTALAPQPLLLRFHLGAAF